MLKSTVVHFVHGPHFLLISVQFHFGFFFLLSFCLFLLSLDLFGLVLKLLDLSCDLALSLNRHSKHAISFPLKTKTESMLFLTSLDFLLSKILSFNSLLLFFFQESDVILVKRAIVFRLIEYLERVWSLIGLFN